MLPGAKTRKSDMTHLQCVRLMCRTELFCVREEQLISAHCIRRNGLLATIRNEPVHELLTRLGFNRRTLLVVDQNYAVLVEQALVAFDMNLEVSLIAKVGPGCTVCHCISAHANSGIQCRAHTGSRLAIPIS